MHSNKKKKKKSGREDPACDWSVCRLAQATQWLEQFRIGRLEPNHEDRLNSKFPPLFLCAIAFWDEHHRETILGDANIYQHLVARNENGVFTSPSLGGIFSPVGDITSVKYPGEARGCFGVGVIKRIIGNNQYEGVRAEPFNYTGRTVVA